MGLIGWFGWVQVFGDESRMGEIAVIGPIVGVLTSPLIAAVATRGGASSIFFFLGLLAFGPLIFNRTTGTGGHQRPTTERRVFGPLLGGVVLQQSGSATLGLLGGSIMILVGLVVFLTRNLTESANSLQTAVEAS